MGSLTARWKLFGELVLDPWNAVLWVSIFGLFFLSSPKLDATTSSLLFVLITLASAILGGRITKQWVDITEGGIVVARGKAAVRNLKLLLRNIAALESRIRLFLSQQELEKHPEVTRRNYEEIIETCNLLEEETVNSIENWTDIVPEADIATQIGLISELKGALDNKESELGGLKQQLAEDKGRSEKEREQLGKEVERKESQIHELERELRGRRAGLRQLGLESLERDVTAMKALAGLDSVFGPRAGIDTVLRGLGTTQKSG